MTLNNELVQVVQQLIDAGSNYRTEELSKLYAPDLQNIMVQPDRKTIEFDYEQSLEFFRERKASGTAPILDEAEFLVSQQQGDLGFVIVARAPKKRAKYQVIVTLMLRKTEQGFWQIFREHSVITVKPK
ncbi:hypothetical protein, partial [Corynebacterium freiburgense]|uniref:hypothetical protein n=1 Tax=Corynebacterium freiburgense TaxID=556548 RepID=UPI0005580ED1